MKVFCSFKNVFLLLYCFLVIGCKQKIATLAQLQEGKNMASSVTEAVSISAVVPDSFVNLSSYEVIAQVRKILIPVTLVGVSKTVEISANEIITIIRKMKFKEKNYFVFIRDKDFETGIIDEQTLIQSASEVLVGNFFTLSKYSTLLQKSFDNPLTHLPLLPKTDFDAQAVPNYALTVDMCPAQTEQWEEEFFLILNSIGKRLSNPVPVAIGLTAHWAQAHSAAFQKLRLWEKQNLLSITWFNHSYSHPIAGSNWKNGLFLTAPGVVFKNEILNMEKFFLENGILFSVFFRFPGFKHNPSLLSQLKTFSLIPVDRAPVEGRGDFLKSPIVLMHGNGNAKKNMQMVIDTFGQVINGTVVIRPLKESIL